MSKQKKALEDMSIEELTAELSKVHKQTKFKAEKVKTDENGTILLDPTKKMIESGMRMMRIMIWCDFA
ncbi:hypothetical protein EYB33_00425 (plasmid) [Lysinibacillus sphaericus]|uniref:hypothetical protein n=1 Tax=Lysinibacillus sphaericus TaxID=1421 RepID=UPI001E3C7DF1|nr:hypothetical protein [Lysinibacillus sphaericus]UDK94854.1 hypothetical protein EYB33_00425 [Lysinibacillus sphaericus]